MESSILSLVAYPESPEERQDLSPEPPELVDSPRPSVIAIPGEVELAQADNMKGEEVTLVTKNEPENVEQVTDEPMEIDDDSKFEDQSRTVVENETLTKKPEEQTVTSIEPVTPIEHLTIINEPVTAANVSVTPTNESVMHIDKSSITHIGKLKNPFEESKNSINKPENPIDELETCIDEPKNPIDKPENPINQPEKLIGQSEKPMDVLEKPLEEFEKPIKESEKLIDEQEKPMEEGENSPVEVGKLTEKSESRVEKSKKTIEMSERPFEKSKKPIEMSERPFEKLEKFIEQSEKPIEQSEKPIEKSEKPPSKESVKHFEHPGNLIAMPKSSTLGSENFIDELKKHTDEPENLKSLIGELETPIENAKKIECKNSSDNSGTHLDQCSQPIVDSETPTYTYKPEEKTDDTAKPINQSSNDPVQINTIKDLAVEVKEPVRQDDFCENESMDTSKPPEPEHLEIKNSPKHLTEANTESLMETTSDASECSLNKNIKVKDTAQPLEESNLEAYTNPLEAEVKMDIELSEDIVNENAKQMDVINPYHDAICPIRNAEERHSGLPLPLAIETFTDPGNSNNVELPKILVVTSSIGNQELPERPVDSKDITDAPKTLEATSAENQPELSRESVDIEEVNEELHTNLADTASEPKLCSPLHESPPNEEKDEPDQSLVSLPVTVSLPPLEANKEFNDEIKVSSSLVSEEKEKSPNHPSEPLMPIEELQIGPSSNSEIEAKSLNEPSIEEEKPEKKTMPELPDKSRNEPISDETNNEQALTSDVLDESCSEVLPINDTPNTLDVKLDTPNFEKPVVDEPNFEQLCVLPEESAKEDIINVFVASTGLTHPISTQREDSDQKGHILLDFQVKSIIPEAPFSSTMASEIEGTNANDLLPKSFEMETEIASHFLSQASELSLGLDATSNSVDDVIMGSTLIQDDLSLPGSLMSAESSEFSFIKPKSTDTGSINLESLQSETPQEGVQPVPCFEEETRSSWALEQPANKIKALTVVKNLQDEGSQGSQNASRKRPFLDDESSHIFKAANLFEYQWPLEKGDFFLLQEQICEYLGVKSFKRKYPDIPRRNVDIDERQFLKERNIVSELQGDLGLTALRSEEVLELMSKDYPEKYQEYVHVLQEKQRQAIANKNKEYANSSVDKNKVNDILKKAIKSAAEYNSHLNQERREERKTSFDLQTYTIHVPASKALKLDLKETKVGKYPVSLIQGQFQDYYRKYSNTELKYLPINTVVYGPLQELNTKYLPQPCSDGSQSDSDESCQSDGSSSSSPGTHDSGDSSSGSEGPPPVKRIEIPMSTVFQAKEKLNAICKVCHGNDEHNKTGQPEELVHCSECKTSSHPGCLELTTEMVAAIKTYPWQCMDCKTCMHCMDPYDEDKMMFCDKCDRGYHTFCVGLKTLPSGRWICQLCGQCSSCGSKTPSGGGESGSKLQWQLRAANGSSDAEPQLLCAQCSKQKKAK